MERNWDPQVKIFFFKIVRSLSYGIMWLTGSVIAGIYYKLGYTILFYALMLVTLLLLLRYLYRLWKD